jgi:hypothetical protein
LWSGSAKAQGQWYVLAHDGPVTVSTRLIRFGDPIAFDAKVELGATGYLALFSDKGSLIELDKEGTFIVSEQLKFPKTLEGFSAKELISKSQFAVTDPPLPTGPACRNTPEVDFLTGGGSFFEEDSVRISWKRMPQDSLFTFFIQDPVYNESVYALHTSKNVVVLPLEIKARIKDKIEEGESFFVELESHAYHAQSEIPMKLVSLESADWNWRMEVFKTFSDKNPAGCLMRALLLEARGYSFAADQYFRKEIRLKPQLGVYKKVNKNYRDQFTRDCR